MGIEQYFLPQKEDNKIHLNKILKTVTHCSFSVALEISAKGEKKGEKRN